jgi:hypothetical protein
MLFIAAAYYYLNRADPDCGTTFAWVTRAMGPHLDWIGGWGSIVADIIFTANLAQIGQDPVLPARGRDRDPDRVLGGRPRPGGVRRRRGVGHGQPELAQSLRHRQPQQAHRRVLVAVFIY